MMVLRFRRFYGFRALWRVPLAMCALLLAFLLIDNAYWPYGRDRVGRTANRGENGLWLSDAWCEGRYDGHDLGSLGSRLQAHGIRWAYFHIRSVDRSGRLVHHHSVETAALLAGLHRRAPGVRSVAWVYVGNAQGKGRVDLGRPDVRANLAREAAWLTRDGGFDGIEWDYEICPDGDRGFLALLDETRAAIPPGKYLCVATALWQPVVFRHWGWSDSYLHEVCRRADQVHVMAYDSGIYLPRAYAADVAAQTQHALDAAAGTPCRVWIGIPSYGPGGLSHHAGAENVRDALIGVREAVARRRETSALGGVAVFADYTTQPSEWRDFDRLWLER